MSWRRAQHLVCRGRGYQVRLPVPADVQSKLHRKEFRWSVRTKDIKTATDRAVQATLAFRQLCDKVRRMNTLGINEAQKLAQQFYEKLVANYDAPSPIQHDEFDIELGHQAVMAEEEISSLETQLQSQQYKPDVVDAALRATKAAGYTSISANSDEFQRACEGIARAQIEFARFALFRQADRIGDYQPADGLFSIQTRPLGLQSIAIGKSLTLDEALEVFFAVKTEGMNSGGSVRGNSVLAG